MDFAKELNSLASQALFPVSCMSLWFPKCGKDFLILPLTLAVEVKFIFNIQQCFRTLSRLQLKENQLGNTFFFVLNIQRWYF